MVSANVSQDFSVACGVTAAIIDLAPYKTVGTLVRESNREFAPFILFDQAPRQNAFGGRHTTVGMTAVGGWLCRAIHQLPGITGDPLSGPVISPLNRGEQ